MIPKNTENLRGEDFKYWDNETYGIRVGCGRLYVTICYDEKRRFKKLLIPRNSKFFCPLTTRHAIAKLATFSGKRNLKQTIKDLRGERPLVGKTGHYCDKYSVVAKATSCFDAVSQVMDDWIKTKRKNKRS